MSWNFIICCALVQFIFVDSIEVHEDVIEDFPNISDNSNNQDKLVNATLAGAPSEINSTEVGSNNVTIVTPNLIKNNENLNNVSKQIDEKESFRKETSIEVLQKEDDKTQENSTASVKFKKPVERYSIDEGDSIQNEASGKILQKEDGKIQENFTNPVKYKKSSFLAKTYSTEIKPQAFSYSPKSHSIKKELIPEPNVITKHLPQPVFTPSSDVENDFEDRKIVSANTVGTVKELNTHSPEIISEKFSKSTNLQSLNEKSLPALIGSESKLSVPEKVYSTELKFQVSQPDEPQNDKEGFMPVRTVFGKTFSQPIFIPSPEVKVNNFGSAVLFDKDSFQPIRHPLFSLNKKELVTPTRRISIDYQDKHKLKIKKNGGPDYALKSQVFGENIIKEIQPKRQVSQVKRRNELGYWVVLDNKEEELNPQNKIINFEQYEPFSDQDDYRSSAVKPVHEEVRGDHPYPFEYVRDDVSPNWLHSSPPPLEGAEYEDHSYDDIPLPPPSPSRPHSLANTHPDWESKFTRGKEVVKPSPLRSILHVLGTIVPIGLLLSALTPNVVMINPNATSPLKQTPANLNLFRGRQRSLQEDEIIGKIYSDDVIRKLAGVRGQKPRAYSACDKKQICEHLALHGAALGDLQKTIENILDRSPGVQSEVNVPIEELFAAARGDGCSSLFVCKEIATTAASD